MILQDPCKMLQLVPEESFQDLSKIIECQIHEDLCKNYTYTRKCMHHTYLPTYLPTYQPFYLPSYLPTYRPTDRPTYLPACLGTHLQTYLHT